MALCTDDPTFFHTSLSNEISIANAKFGLSEEEVIECIVNQWRYAFDVSPEEKEQRIAEIRKIIQSKK